jgi:hypothetical protein
MGIIIAKVLGWFAMPLIRWGAIAVAGLLFTAFMRADAAAPYKQKVAELETAIATRDKIIADHDKAAEVDRVEAEELDKAIEEFAHDIRAKTGSNCLLSPDQLKRLQLLAGAN